MFETNNVNGKQIVECLMNRFSLSILIGLTILLISGSSTYGQRAGLGQRTPHIGYVYPAGGQQGTTFEVTIGGQYLNTVTAVRSSGNDVHAKVVQYSRPLNPKEANELRNKLREAQKRMAAARKKDPKRRRPGNFFQEFTRLAQEAGIDDDDLKALQEFRKLRTDPKRQINPQLLETVTLEVQIAATAKPGAHELRLLTPLAISNPIRFYVDQLPEYRESEPNDKTADSGVADTLPVVVNGQILPGDVDRFRFHARKGERLVVAVRARELIPYLADAVPGWFQATVALYDVKGKELAFADDYQFNPDPVLYYEVPEAGEYVLEIHDAIYRGREDFVYRITLGEVPWVTNIFPLGSRRGDTIDVRLTGWNLPENRLTVTTSEKTPRVHSISIVGDRLMSNSMAFSVDTLPECLEREPNDGETDTTRGVQHVELPIIINGRIDRPGDSDVFSFEGHAGETIVAEVTARRLNSSVDSVLKLTDAAGHVLAKNDDHQDKGAGLTTHQADSWLMVRLPADGVYSVALGDTQHQGGAECGYRLRLSRPRPDFDLRVVPSSINTRPGMAVPLTVYALRKDGFDGEIAVRIKEAPAGFVLNGGWIPAGQDHVRLTLTAPSDSEPTSFRLQLEGHAVVQGRGVRRSAVPTEDMMQAFIYRHLVPAQELVASVGGRRRYGPPVRLLGAQPVKIPSGSTVQVRLLTPRTPLLRQVQFELSEPPEGISIEDVQYGRTGLALVLRADAEKIPPGLKGNLIVQAFVERSIGPASASGQRRKQRIPQGTLPAISFEVVQ